MSVSPQLRIMKILVIEDEEMIRKTLAAKVCREGHEAFMAESAEEGMRVFQESQPDLILLDVMLPQRSGFEFCQWVRQQSETPIIFLSARADELSRIQGLEMGADDYISKPFHLNEVAARIKAVLRRTASAMGDAVIESSGITIDPNLHEARLNGELMNLSPKEFRLLWFFVSHRGKVFSREVIIDRVWGVDSYVSGRTVDVHVRWLRAKIELNPKVPVRLLTIWGFGYKFVG